MDFKDPHYKVEWTPEKFIQFMKAYKKAVKEQRSAFEFEGRAFSTDYAHYFILYLENRLIA